MRFDGNEQLQLRLVVIAMFMGRYNHTIDPKGRLSIPSKYRETLGEEFVVSKGMDGCLFVYDIDDWKVFEAKLASLPLINQEARQFARFFLSGAQYVTVDKQGRILMPQDLREFAGLEKDVVWQAWVEESKFGALKIGIRTVKKWILIRFLRE